MVELALPRCAQLGAFATPPLNGPHNLVGNLPPPPQKKGMYLKRQVALETMAKAYPF